MSTTDSRADHDSNPLLGLGSSAWLGPPVPKPPNAEGQTLCHVRWMIETPGGWLGAWDKGAFAALIDAAVAAERERCARLCEGAREAAEHSSDGLKRAGAMAMAASCAKLIRA